MKEIKIESSLTQNFGHVKKLFNVVLTIFKWSFYYYT